jgi:hypothetical protein
MPRKMNPASWVIDVVGGPATNHPSPAPSQSVTSIGAQRTVVHIGDEFQAALMTPQSAVVAAVDFVKAFAASQVREAPKHLSSLSSASMMAVAFLL